MTNDQNKTASPPKPESGYDVYDGGPPKPLKGLFQRLLDYYHGSGWQDKHFGQALILMIICGILGIIFILFYALQIPYQMTLYSNTTNATIPTPIPTFTFWDSVFTIISVFGAGVLIATGSFFLGGFFGFLFGIPKTIKQKPQNQGDSSQSNSVQGQYEENTNLEEVSDWLTKIIIGVGLVELTKIPGLLSQYAVMIGPALGGIPSSGAFGIAILVCYSIIGFLCVYLATKGYMENELENNARERLSADREEKLKAELKVRVMAAESEYKQLEWNKKEFEKRILETEMRISELKQGMPNKKGTSDNENKQ